MTRALISLVILLSIIFLPSWVYVPLLVLAIVVTPLFWEGIILAFLIDVLYGRAPHMGITWHFTTALAALILVLVMLPVRKSLRMYV